MNEIDFGTAVDTSQVMDMSQMFDNCINLSNLDLSSFDTFDTSQVTDMSYMFYDCSNLTSLDVSGFDTSKVTFTYDMFNSCNSLKYLICSDNKIRSAYEEIEMD